MSGQRGLHIRLASLQDGRDNPPSRRVAPQSTDEAVTDRMRSISMNASLESMLPALRQPAVCCHRPCSMRHRSRGHARGPGRVALYHGGKLSSVRIAWRMAGPASAPVVCALGGISANRRVCLTESRARAGGRDRGTGRALDSNASAF